MEENKNINTPENDQAQNATAEQKQPQARANRPAQANAKPSQTRPNANRQARPTSASSEDEKKKRAAAAPLSVSQQEQKKRAAAAVVPGKNKLTRKSFGRKVVIAGVALFMSIALIATGFAAWVIATDAKVDGSVGATVGTVTDAGMEITLDSTVATQSGNGYQLIEKFKFEPVETKTDGNVRWDGVTEGEGDSKVAVNAENLDIVITGQVSNPTYLAKADGGMTLTIKLPKAMVYAMTIETDGTNTVEYTIKDTNTTKKMDFTKPYIALPEYDQAKAGTNGAKMNPNTDGSVSVTVNFAYSANGVEADKSFWITKDGEKDIAKFKYTIAFQWGAYFAGVNPCYYYDGKDASGNALYTADSNNENDKLTSEEYAALLAKGQQEIVDELNAFYYLLSGNAKDYVASEAETISLVIAANAA